MKYSYYKTEDGRFFITHTEGETNTWIAMTSDAEKADFLTKAANQFSNTYKGGEDGMKWRKESERLPDDNITVFLWVNRTNRNIGHYDHTRGFWNWYEYGKVIEQSDLPENTIIEWLDESVPPYKEEVDREEAAIKSWKKKPHYNMDDYCDGFHDGIKFIQSKEEAGEEGTTYHDCKLNGE